MPCLFIENHDSFSFNIVDSLRALGQTVRVVDHRELPDLRGVTHVVLGPGPGEPSTSGRLMDWLSLAVESDKAVLGICLGHQAIGQYFDSQIKPAIRAIHGEVHAVYHEGAALFTGLTSPLMATRYHSLCVSGVKDPLQLHAWSVEGEVMAIAHRHKPIFGVQFHPESFLSEQGVEIFRNFFK